MLLPAWNEAELLPRCLDALLAIDGVQLEIILCAGGDDGTEAVAVHYAATYPTRIVFIEQSRGEGKQAALRRCLVRSRGSLLFLTDADCAVPAATLRRLIAALEPGIAAVTGSAEPFSEQRGLPWVRHQWATVRAVDRRRPPESTGILGRCCVVRREAVEAVGGFAEPVRIGTDYYLAKRLLARGYRIRFVDAPVQTEFHTGLGDYLAQQSRWMRNVVVHGARFGARDEVSRVLKTMGIGTVLLGWPLGWPWTRRWGIAAWLFPMAWMTRVRVRNLRALEKEAKLAPMGTARLLASAILFSVADLMAWTRPLLDLVSSRRRQRW